MIKIENKKKCCGCTACYNICPVQAITMSPDNEGFLYPVIDGTLCVNCGMCEKVCPVHNKQTHEEQTEGYIVRHKDLSIVEDSTSGGAFTAFSTTVIDEGGIVYGAGYDEEMRVVCKKAKTSAELCEMRGSKFVQSDLNETFHDIKQQLEDGIVVLFTGTPCQVTGLISFLQKKPKNLICIDFVCRGVASPYLWYNYVNLMQKKYNSKIIGARFKNKTYGYHATTMKIDFENGKSYYGSGRIDPMMKAFVNEMSSRPSCSNCAFKDVERVSDLTMFDCYEFTSITGKIDDNKGYTSLLVHTEKGHELFEKVTEKFVVFKADVEKLVSKNGIMALNSALPSNHRECFYEMIQNHSIDVAMKKISPITTMDHVVEKSKRFFYRIGFIQVVKRFRKHRTLEVVSEEVKDAN